jgi:hypothetical protein
MRGLRDFVPGQFPLPASPIYDGLSSLRDFVAAGFPLPQNPVRYIAAADGELPRAPELSYDDIHQGRGEVAGMGCGGSCGGSCAGCAGLGAFDFANLIPGETFNIPNTYLVAAAIAAVLIISSAGAGGGGGRRRRSNPARRRRASAKRRR